MYQKDIVLEPVIINAHMVFNNVQFQNNSFELPSASFIELDKLFQILQENPTIQLEISGHTDNLGKAADNLALSTNRAKAIVNYLTNKGISHSRLTYKGYAAEKPIAENTTEIGRSKNRRTEFTITGL